MAFAERNEGYMAKSKRSLRPIPKFASEAAERAFWETHDSVDYVDWSKATVKPVARAARG